MKRAVLVGSLALVLALGCHPSEPKQALVADPIDDDSTAAAASSSSPSSGSGASSHGRDDVLAPPSTASGRPGKPGSAGKAEPTQVASLTARMEGMRWGMSHAEVLKTFTENGGTLWKDYDERLAKSRVGPEMTAIENEREQAKQAFVRSFIEFKETPTGYDATGIRGEYTYRNHESLMVISRQGKKRFFFFINDRLWKLYDEVQLAESGSMGKTFVDAVNKLNGDLGAQGRIQAPDPSKGVNATTVDWKDASSHLRTVDRSGERVVAIVLEESGTLGNLASLRANKPEDPTAVDPSIAAVTKGTLSDPNAIKPAASATGAGAKPKKK